MPDPLRESVSASQAAALIDASPYMTKWMLARWLAFGEETPGIGDNRMDWGTRMERICLEAAAEDLMLEVIPTRADDGTQPYVRNGHLGCTRDATIICPDRGVGALETKCVFDTGVWMEQWGGGKTVPRHIEIQVQTQMLVGDGEKSYGWGVISAWHCAEQKHFERKPIPELWDLLREEARKLFEEIAAGNFPEPFGAPMERPLLDEAFPTAIDNPLDMTQPTPDAIRVAEQVRLLKWHAQERLGHGKTEEAIKAQLFALAGSHDVVNLPHKISFKIKEIFRDGYVVKPGSYRKLDYFVPDSIEDTIVEDFANTELGG